MQSLGRHYLDTMAREFEVVKKLGERAMAQLEPEDFHWTPDPESNSIAIIVKHLHGNMLSRWTDFLTTDGEKEWRDRDGEFIDDIPSREALMNLWEEGWERLLSALESLSENDLQKAVTVRSEPHSVIEAISRAFSHYASHVGQIVYLAKQLKAGRWQTLSIPRGQSKTHKG